MIEIATVDQLELRNRRVFYRVDYNVPVENGRITDATRIEETLPTLQMMRERDARIVIASHFGRPKGKASDAYSLIAVREKLSELLHTEVAWAGDCTSDEAVELSRQLPPVGVLLVENLRFHGGEEANDREFAARLRRLGDVYVNDAFGACHRAHASIVALPELFDVSERAGGLLLAKELEFLQRITNVSDRPFVAVLGGAKISGKIEALEAMMNLADTVLVGGGIANTFLAAAGRAMGNSLVEEDALDVARRVAEADARAQLIVPLDLVVTDSLDTPSVIESVDAERGVADGRMAADIGPETIDRFMSALAEAKTIFWNGPMGVFEKDQFATGTHAVAQAIAAAAAVSVVGGGESVEAVKASGVAERITHISTGGGASLEFVSGATLPGVEVLRRSGDAAGD